MKMLCIACLSILLQGAVFGAFGSLALRGRLVRLDAVKAGIVGFLLYFSAFELVAVPMILLKCSLTLLMWVWTAVCAVVVVLAVRFCSKQWLELARELPGRLREHGAAGAAALAVVAVQCCIVARYQDTTVDATYYIGMVTTAIFTDTMERYSPLSGVGMSSFHIRYVFSAMPMNSAVWAKLLHIHALIEAKVVIPVLHVVCANLILYRLGRRMFAGADPDHAAGEKRRADVMVCFVWLLQMFCYTIYTSADFYLTRSYEGKAILGSVSIPIVLIAALRLWDDPQDRQVWPLLFLNSLSALCFTGSSIILPAALVCALVPVLVIRRQYPPHLIRKLGVCVLPQAAYLAVYLLVTQGVLTLHT